MTQVDARDRLDELNALITAHRYGEAEAIARGVIQAQPDSWIGWKGLSVVFVALQRWQEALPALHKTFELLPTDVDVRNALGSTLEALGRLAEAEAIYRDTLRLGPENPAAHLCLGNVLSGLHRLPESEASYRRALELKPDMHEAWSNLATVLHALGRCAEAEASCRRALELSPQFHQAHGNLGLVLTTLGRFEEATESCRRAVAIRPDYADGHSHLGNALQALGRLPEAEAHYRRALELKPDNLQAQCNLANLLHSLGRYPEAEANHRRALEIHPEFVTGMVNLANTLEAQGRLPEAQAQYRRAIAAGSHRSAEYGHVVNAMNGLSNVLGRMIPEWHVPMMNDAPRNDAYRAALEEAISPETRVLEIGTGSGLLAMMAARAGAREVVTCEAQPLIAETAREIVASNGFASSVRVIAKKSTDIAVGKDMPVRADLLVSEIFSSELLGEGVLPSLEDAKRRLLAPGARIIPGVASMMCALFGGTEVEENIRVGQVSGFDLSKFNAIASQKRYLHRGDLGIELLTAGAEAFTFDFMAQDYFPGERKTLRLPVTAAGRCHGVVQWLRLRMSDSLIFENHPSKKTHACGWQQCFYRFAAPVDMRPGQTAVICAAHNRFSAWFFLEKVE